MRARRPSSGGVRAPAPSLRFACDPAPAPPPAPPSQASIHVLVPRRRFPAVPAAQPPGTPLPPPPSAAVLVGEILTQKTTLLIDPATRTCYGNTKLVVHNPASVAGLHASVDVVSVRVDGEPAAFAVAPAAARSLPPLPCEAPGAGASPADVAREARDAYWESRRAEMERPTLAVAVLAGREGPEESDDDSDDGSDDDDEREEGRRERDPSRQQRAATIEVTYTVPATSGGVRYAGGFACTAHGVHRTREWLPTVDTAASVVRHALTVVVPDGLLAVGPGALASRAAEEVPGVGRCWGLAFDPSLPTAPENLCVAVGPFEGRPVPLSRWPPKEVPPKDVHRHLPRFANQCEVSVLAPAASLAGTAHLARAASQCVEQMERYLGCPFPLEAFRVAFVPRDVLEGPASAGRQLYGACLLPDDLACGTQQVEGFLEAAGLVALAAAQQWFGVLVYPHHKRPAAAAHAPSRWAAAGCARFLRNLAVGHLFGRNEAEYQAWAARAAAVDADVGGRAAPLHPPFMPFVNLKQARGEGGGRDEGRRRRGAAGEWAARRGSDLRGGEAAGEGAADWKAEAFIHALARRVGLDEARKALQTKAREACQATAAGAGSRGGRRLDSKKLLKAFVGQMGEKRMEKALSKRWVHGRGVPTIRVALRYHAKEHLFLLAMEQQGCRIAEISAQAAAQEGGGIASLRLVLHETDGANERTVSLGDAAVVVDTIECISQRKSKRGKRKQKDGAPAEELPAVSSPLQWVSVDSDGLWLADFQVVGLGTLHDTLRCLDHQLRRSRAVGPQMEAVRQLARLAREEPGASARVLGALTSAAADPELNCRVRAAALAEVPDLDELATRGAGPAPALEGRTASELLGLLGDLCPGSSLREVFADLGAYVVARALPRALLLLRDASGRSPEEAVEAVLRVLEEADSAGVQHDDGALRAAFLEALGASAPPPRLLPRVVEQLHRALEVDAVAPSRGHVLTQAGLRGVSRLAAGLRSPLLPAAGVGAFLRQYLDAGRWPGGVRLAALEGAADAAAAAGGVAAALAEACPLVAAEPGPGVRLGAVLHLQVLAAAAWEPHAPGAGGARRARRAAAAAAAPDPAARLGPLPGATPAAALAVLRLMRSCEGPARHACFVLLSSLAGEPPTLYCPDLAFEQTALGWSAGKAEGGQAEARIKGRIKLGGLEALGRPPQAAVPPAAAAAAGGEGEAAGGEGEAAGGPPPGGEGANGGAQAMEVDTPTAAAPAVEVPAAPEAAPEPPAPAAAPPAAAPGGVALVPEGFKPAAPRPRRGARKPPPEAAPVAAPAERGGAAGGPGAPGVGLKIKMPGMGGGGAGGGEKGGEGAPAGLKFKISKAEE